MLEIVLLNVRSPKLVIVVVSSADDASPIVIAPDKTETVVDELYKAPALLTPDPVRLNTLEILFPLRSNVLPDAIDTVDVPRALA